MRNLLALASGLTLLVACDSGPGALPVPPTLKVTSPARSTVQNGAGNVTVSGVVTPNTDGTPVSGVTVNNVAAVVDTTSGNFQATIQVEPGATLIHTEATDANGGKASDTRVIEAGELRAPGANIDSALTVAISGQGFSRISDIASGLIKTTDFNPLLAPLQPMVHNGDESGPDCLYDQLFVDSISMSDAHISLVPVNGGLQFSVELDGLDVMNHVNFAVACVDGSDTLEVTTDSISVSGTLLVSPDGMNGFTTTIDSPQVNVSGFHMDAGGIPSSILNAINMDSAITFIATKAAERFMNPMMNQALASMAGPKTLNLLGHSIDLQVAASDVSFDTSSGVVALDTSFLIHGAENSPGFIFTDNATPNMQPGNGIQMGIADDFANEALAQATALNLLNLSMPVAGGTFDSIQLSATVAPMISANASDGTMKLVLGDMKLQFMQGGTAVGLAYLNATVDLAIAPANNGYGVAIQLGTPVINVDVSDDIANATHLEDADLAKAVQLSLGAQIASVSALLGGIPLPTIANITMTNVSMGADNGYVMVKATL